MEVWGIALRSFFNFDHFVYHNGIFFLDLNAYVLFICVCTYVSKWFWAFHTIPEMWDFAKFWCGNQNWWLFDMTLESRVDVVYS